MNLIKNPLITALQSRFACKAFDPEKKLSEAEINTILESGRLAPSSFGLEPTRVIYSTDAEKNAQLKEICMNQSQVAQSPFVCVLVVKTQDMKPNSPYIRSEFERNMRDPKLVETYLNIYSGFSAKLDLASWLPKQAYLVGANMLSCAAYLGIDSCPIEGFDVEKMQEFLALDGENACLVLAFGHRESEPRYRTGRVDFNEFAKQLL